MSKLTGGGSVILTIDGRDYACRSSETVLEAAFRHNIRLPFSCQVGDCQSCLVRAVEGDPCEKSQVGLKSTHVAQGYFLACQHTLTSDLSITLKGASTAFSSVSVLSNQELSADIHQIRLALPEGFKYHSGQFINLRRDSGEVRSYSLASVAELDNYLEIHVKHFASGVVSHWLCDSTLRGCAIEVSGPFGDCFYVADAEQLERPILLIGTGAGLAPLYGIIKSALSKNHRGEIFLYHGASTRDSLYLIDELHALEAEKTNFHYQPCLSSENRVVGFRDGRAHDVALNDITELGNYLVYLCGNPEMVEAARRTAYLQGAAMQDIFSDAFVRSVSSTQVVTK